jgi:hypothetical protein
LEFFFIRSFIQFCSKQNKKKKAVSCTECGREGMHQKMDCPIVRMRVAAEIASRGFKPEYGRACPYEGCVATGIQHYRYFFFLSLSLSLYILLNLNFPERKKERKRPPNVQPTHQPKRYDGCHLMQCPKCGRGFCFVCGMPKDGTIHDAFEGRYCDCDILCGRGCKCVEASERRGPVSTTAAARIFGVHLESAEEEEEGGVHQQHQHAHAHGPNSNAPGHEHEHVQVQVQARDEQVEREEEMHQAQMLEALRISREEYAREESARRASGTRAQEAGERARAAVSALGSLNVHAPALVQVQQQGGGEGWLTSGRIVALRAAAHPVLRTLHMEGAALRAANARMLERMRRAEREEEEDDDGESMYEADVASIRASEAAEELHRQLEEHEREKEDEDASAPTPVRAHHGVSSSSSSSSSSSTAQVPVLTPLHGTRRSRPTPSPEIDLTKDDDEKEKEEEEEEEKKDEHKSL